MKIKGLIKKLQSIEKKHGNLDIFTNWDCKGPGFAERVDVEEFDEYEKNHELWDMPKKWVEIK